MTTLRVVPVSGLRSPVSGLRSPVSGLRSRSPVSGLRSPVSGLRSRSPVSSVSSEPSSTLLPMFEAPIQRLIDELSRLPGVGQKSAQRLAFHLLHIEETDARRLAEAIISMRQQVRLCERCFNVTDSAECSICRDQRRDPTQICVVERAQDIVVVEKTQDFAAGITYSADRSRRSKALAPTS